MPRDTLIVQFRTDGAIGDFDRLVEIEDLLIQAFSQNSSAEVDGHDFGRGTMNIFIFPNGSWSSAIEVVEAYLRHRGILDQATIAKRRKSGSVCVVWPPGFKGQFEL